MKIALFKYISSNLITELINIIKRRRPFGVMELDCKIQNYEWGKPGLKSTVASLYKNAHSDFAVKDDLPYAELWMGTHPNGPSTIKGSGKTLTSVIQENPTLLGSEVLKHFGNDLPFLFKVLSVNKALSIQVHPNKKHAEQLHAKRPDLYKDPNHKPELAIALTSFEAMAGFRPISDIKLYIKEIPELQNLVGSSAASLLLQSNESNYPAALKDCFKQLMLCKEEIVVLETKNILERFSKQDVKKNATQLSSLFERLNYHYPNDVGCFAIYFLNVLEMKPLEALYLAANEPHAYLSGDCIECMACSDNVVRAGLTPKYKDVETLCEMLNYHGEAPEHKLFKPIQESTYCQMFKPPVPDFAVAKIEIPEGVKNYPLASRTSASILLNVKGSGKINSLNFTPGTVVFIPANEVANITNIDNLLAFQAMANV